MEMLYFLVLFIPSVIKFRHIQKEVLDIQLLLENGEEWKKNVIETMTISFTPFWVAD